jgi:Kef-type K+ transport system membrane component KefB
VGGVLAIVGIIGKIAAGFVPYWFRGRKLLIGVAMVPRGEVGLIFARMGLASGGIDAELFGAVMLMVLVTTLVTPPVLAQVVQRAPTPRAPPEEALLPDHFGIDDFVAGEAPAHAPDQSRQPDAPPPPSRE